MILFPPAKINLGLHILRKRPDGYHDISSCLYPIPLFDVLEILEADVFEFKQTGLTIPGDNEDNLVVKAWELMRAEYNVPPVYIHLRKNIPMGAGLGGGSADATYTLMGLNELFSLGLSDDTLRELSAKLGSDCPFFVHDGPQLAEGRGEVLSPIKLDLSGYYLKLINPGIHVSTSDAYANVVFSIDQEAISEILSDSKRWKAELTNGFEQSVFQLHPELDQLKEAIYAEGAVYAAMSGSGSSMFGLFNEEPALTHPNMFESVIKL